MSKIVLSVAAALIAACICVADDAAVLDVSPRRAAVEAAKSAVVPVRIVFSVPAAAAGRETALDVAVAGGDATEIKNRLRRGDHFFAVSGDSAVDAAAALLWLLRLPERDGRSKLLIIRSGNPPLNRDDFNRLAAAAAKGGVRITVIPAADSRRLDAALAAARTPAVGRVAIRIVTPPGIERRFSGAVPAWEDAFELLLLCPSLGAGERLEAEMTLRLPPVPAGRTREIGIVMLEYRDAVSGVVKSEKIQLTAEFFAAGDAALSNNAISTAK